MTFHEFLISRRPLYKDVDYDNIMVSWKDAKELFEDYLKDNQPILTVEVHEARTNKATIEVSAPVKHTQDNHLKTRL